MLNYNFELENDNFLNFCSLQIPLLNNYDLYFTKNTPLKNFNEPFLILPNMIEYIVLDNSNILFGIV
jgi:hypothetical protein